MRDGVERGAPGLLSDCWYVEMVTVLTFTHVYPPPPSKVFPDLKSKAREGAVCLLQPV